MNDQLIASVDMSNGHHPGITDVDKLVGHIITDVTSPSPKYDYNLTDTGDYSTSLSVLVQSRRGGADTRAVQKILDGFKAKKDTPLGKFFQSKNGAKPETKETRSSIKITTRSVAIPPLPSYATLPPEASKGASEWLDLYIQHSQKWSPRGHASFHETVGIWVMSTTSAHRVYCNFGKREYTSLYFALVALTTLYKKTTTAGIGQEVLEKAGLKFLLAPDMVTPQKLMSDMSGWVPSKYASLTPEEQDNENLFLAFSAQRGWYYEEFGMQLDSMMHSSGAMADFRGLLRVFDDHKPDYTYGTISRGHETITRPFLSLLGSMTSADIAPHAANNSKLWRDGFLARFVFATPPMDDYKFTRFPTGERRVPPELITPLQLWHQRLGIPEIDIEFLPDKDGNPRKDAPPKFTRGAFPEHECILSKEAIDCFYNYEKALTEMAIHQGMLSILGNYGRLPKAALRVATLLASQQNSPQVELRHWARAQEIAERWREGLHHMISQMEASGEENSEQVEDKILKLLAKKAQPLTAREVSQGIWGLKSEEAERKLELLVKSGEVEPKKIGRKQTYTLKCRGVDGVEV